MKEIDFKLKFETSENVLEEMPTLLEKIVFQLRNEKYHIIHQSENLVTFDDYKDPWSKVRGLTSKLYEGKFEIIKEADLITIKLTYFIPCKIFIIYFLAIIFIALFTTILTLIMDGILIIFFIMEISGQKNISEKLINAIKK